VDLEVISTLNAAPARLRKRLLSHLANIKVSPDRLSDYFEHDLIGRRVEISICSGHAIHYWIDFADRHVKVLAVLPADS
jgi:hypothetical protein